MWTIRSEDKWWQEDMKGNGIVGEDNAFWRQTMQYEDKYCNVETMQFEDRRHDVKTVGNYYHEVTLLTSGIMWRQGVKSKIVMWKQV